MDEPLFSRNYRKHNSGLPRSNFRILIDLVYKKEHCYFIEIIKRTDIVVLNKIPIATRLVLLLSKASPSKGLLAFHSSNNKH